MNDAAPPRRATLHTLWPALSFLALTVALTWPQAARLSEGVSPGTDSLLHAWVLAWNARALLHDPAGIWSPPIFYPYADALAFSDNHLALSLVAAPLIWAGLTPVTAYNTLVLLSYTLGALAVYHLAHEITGRRLASFVAGAAFGFCAFRMAHYFHLQLLQTAWLTWALLFARRVLLDAQPRVRDALALGAFASLQCVTALYYLPFTALTLGLLGALWAAGALWRWARRGAPLPWRRAGLLLMAAAVAAVVVVPLTLPYLRAYRVLAIARSPNELATWSAPLQAYLAVDATNRIYGALGGVFEAQGGENALGLGLVVPALAAAALGLAGTDLLRRRRGDETMRADTAFLGLLGLVAFVLSLGTALRLVRGGDPLPIPLPYALLYQHVPGLAALRVPARWGVLVALASSVLAAIALARLLPRARWGAVAGSIVLTLVLAERVSAPVPLVSSPDAAGAPPVYAWLAEPAQRGARVVLELPIGRIPRGEEVDRIVRRQFFQPLHWKGLPVAYSGAIPFGVNDVMGRAQQIPDANALRLMRLAGIDTLVLHHPEYEPTRLAELLAALDASPLVRRIGEPPGATVYALTPAADVADPPPGAAVYVSADERMPGMAVAGLTRRWSEQGHALYGPGRARYYAPLAAATPGQVFAYGLLAADEDPRPRGFAPENQVWRASGLALYAADPRLRVNLPLGAPEPGRFHPTHPTALTIVLAPTQLDAGGARARWATPLARATVELDIASLQAQTIEAGGRRVEVAPGLSSVALDVRPGQELSVSGAPGGIALLRVRVYDGSGRMGTASGAALAADSAFDGSTLRVTARAAGAATLRLVVRGAATADDRPVLLASGSMPAAGSAKFALDLLRPTGAWLDEAGEPQDGRYIAYLLVGDAPVEAGIPVAKFNIRGGGVVDAEPVPLPLTTVADPPDS
ncbi:MAG: hypothetical protein RLZZ387_1065 [Chloroflexota bacterium]|jgi:hypothetical protein